MYVTLSRFSITALLFASLLFSCGKQEPPPQEQHAPPPPAVTVDFPKQQNVTEYLDLTGRIAAAQTVSLQSRVEGYLEEINFTDGTRVEKDDLLFQIDPAPYQAIVKEAEAALVARKADQALAEKVYQRRKSALADRAVSELAVEEAEAQVNLARASVEAAKAALDRAQLDLDYTQITAPISGRVSRRMVDVGNLIRGMDSTVLATIIADDPIYAYFTLSEAELLRFNQRVSHEQLTHLKPAVLMGLSDSHDYPFKGTVDYVDNVVDDDTGTLQARAIFDNPDHRLVPGLYARVRVPVEQLENALLVPETALGISQAGRFLLVVDEKETVIYKPVTIGSKVGDLRVIRTGITTEDRVIVQGGQRVQPGMAVTVSSAADQNAQAAGGSR